MAFENLLTLAAEADRQPIKELADRYPWLKKFAEKGERYEQLEPEFKALYDDGDPLKVVGELKRWREWNQKDWVAHQNQTAQLRDLLASATTKVTELENRSDVEMTPEEVRTLVAESVKATLSEAGVVDKKGLEQSLIDLVEKQIKPQIEANANGLTSRFEDVYAELTPKMLDHKETFGETLKMRDLFKYMKDTAQMDPIKAYDAMVAPRLREKEQKEWEAKIVEAENKGVAKGRLERAAASGRSMPVDGKGPVKLGPIQRMQFDKFGKPKEGEEAKVPRLGTGVISNRATQEHLDRQAAAGAA